MFSIQDVLIFVGVILVFVWWRRKSLRDFAAKIPGDDGWPLIGNSYRFIGVDHKDLFLVLFGLSKRFECASKIWFGPILNLVVKDPDDIKIALNSGSCFAKAPLVYDLYMPYGVFAIADLDEYKMHRRVVTPLFYPAAFKAYLPVLNVKMKAFLSSFESKLTKEVAMEISQHSQNYTLDTLMANMFGIHEISEEARVKLVNDVEIYLGIQNIRIFKLWLRFEPILRLTKYFKLLQKHKGDTYKFAENIMHEYEKKYQAGSVDEQVKAQNYLDHLYKIRHTMTYSQMKEEIVTFIIGGFDTTGKAIAGTLLLLAMNSEAQEKVLTELKSIFTSKDDDVDEESFNKLEYLELVIKESMRLIPISLFTMRLVTKDVPFTNYTVPAGTYLSLAVLEVHQSKKQWGDDALEFRPERFSEENFKKVHPYAYLPFSKGSRMCPGYRYGMMTMKVFLSKFLMNYRVTTDLVYKDLEFFIELTTSIKQGFTVKVEKR